MTREMQARLVAVLRDAMDAQGIMQKDVARHVGTSAGTLSTAFSCKGQMREERWRMACELCGVDFDHFMKTQQHEVGQSPTNESECLHSPSVASTRPCAGEWPNQSRAEQSRAEQSKPSLRMLKRRYTPCPL